MNSTSLNQIAFNLLNTMRGGRSSHSEHISLDQIKYAIKYYRALFIRRDQERNFNKSRMFEQDLGFLPISEVDTAEDGSLSSSVTVYKTDDMIPAPIRLKHSEAITFVGGKDKQGRPTPLVSADRSYWQQYNKYTATQPEAYYRNGYVYLPNTEYTSEVNIRGIFEDPEEVYDFIAANDFDVYDGNSPFPISMDMLQRITQGILNGELSALVQTPDDEELDRKQNP